MSQDNQNALANEFISFRLGGETFAVAAIRIREVLKNRNVTQVPGMPDCLPGVLNLRGNVISVIDPAIALGMTSRPLGERRTTWFVIVEGCLDHETLQVGLLVDMVEDVIQLDDARIEPPPELGMAFDSNFVSGLGKGEGESYTILLDVDRLVAHVVSETDRERRAAGPTQRTGYPPSVASGGDRPNGRVSPVSMKRTLTATTE